jgi:quercetin dioxygenase-like cupin family protein
MRFVHQPKFVSAVALVLIAHVAAIAQQLPERVVIFNPANATWVPVATPGAVAGLEQIIIQGHPAKAGPYIVRTKYPPNFSGPPHTHPDDRIATVISGTFYVGFANSFDGSQLISLPAGSVFTEPAGVAHFNATKAEPVIIQFSGTGPTRVIPADPSKK